MTNSALSPYAYDSDELDALAAASNYYRWLARLCAPHLGTDVLEIGAGIGTFAAALLAAAPEMRLELVEPAINHVPVLERRFADDDRVRVRAGYFPAALGRATPMDTVLLVNVLEHVEDAQTLLDAVRTALRPHGRLILHVPAGERTLFGSLDEEFGHRRRFSDASLAELLAECGYSMVSSRHVNSLGVIPWFVLGRVLRLRTLPGIAVRVYDALAIPFLERLEHRWAPAFGQSLFAVAAPRP